MGNSCVEPTNAERDHFISMLQFRQIGHGGLLTKD